MEIEEITSEYGYVDSLSQMAHPAGNRIKDLEFFHKADDGVTFIRHVMTEDIPQQWLEKMIRERRILIHLRSYIDRTRNPQLTTHNPQP